MSMAFYARDSQIVILELGDYKSQIGMADYLKLPQITALTPSTKQPPTLATKKQLLLALFKKYDIKIDRNDFPVLLLTKTETKAELENIIQIMFETLNAPGLYLLDTSLACLYACGLITGLVVDIGYNSTRVCPVFENGVIRSAIVEVNVGGKDVDEILLKSLKLTDAVELLKLKQAVVICAGSKLEAEETKPVDYNGKQIGNIRAKCVEVLFDPSINNKHILSVQQAISHSIKQACEPPKRVSLWENIILTGGSSEISGIKERLEQEILKLVACSETCNEYQAKEIKYQTSPEYLGTFKDKHSQLGYLGGIIVGKLVFGSGGYGFISKKDYNQYGPFVHASPI